MSQKKVRLYDLPDIPFHQDCQCRTLESMQYSNLLDLVELGVPHCPVCSRAYVLNLDDEVEV